MPNYHHELIFPSLQLNSMKAYSNLTNSNVIKCSPVLLQTSMSNQVQQLSFFVLFFLLRLACEDK